MTAPRKRATKAAAAPEQSQRERLLGRPRPSLPYRLLVNQDDAEAARAEQTRVQAATRQTLLREDEGTPEYLAAQQQREQAQAAVDACYETIVLTALPPREFEALEALNPPTAQQMEQAKSEREQAQKRGEELPDWPSYNDDTFWPALLAASVDNGMTADDWATFLAEHVSGGESAGLRIALLSVNRQERAADPLVLPKGLMRTTS